MKILKYLFFLLSIAIAGYLLVCLLAPKNLNIEESLEMKASTSIVFNIINNLPESENWNDFFHSDTTLLTTYSGPAEGVGAISEWTSQQGNGRQEIIESIKNERVRSLLKFGGFSGPNFATMSLEDNDSSTKLTWDYNGANLSFLRRGMIALFRAKARMRKSYKAGLQNISTIAEERANKVYNGYKIEEVHLPDRFFLMNRQEVQYNNVQQFFASNLGSLFTKVQEAGLEMHGMPCGLYFRTDNTFGIVDMAAAIPTVSQISVPEALSFHIEAQDALQIDYYGEYSEIESAHLSMVAFLKDRNYLQDIPITEEYFTDPAQEPDPSKWLTKITYYYTEKS